MPNDTINNSIKKASGEGNTANYEEITYEGYGPSGIAVIVNCSTDNKNRTAADVRHVFSKSGGNLGTNGCVAYMFEKKGVLVVEKEGCPMSEDDLMMLAIDNGAEDFEPDEAVYTITTTPTDFTACMEALQSNNINFLEAGVQMVPNNYVDLDEKDAEKMQRLVDNLEELDDVLEVYHNWNE